MPNVHAFSLDICYLHAIDFHFTCIFPRHLLFACNLPCILHACSLDICYLHAIHLAFYVHFPSTFVICKQLTLHFTCISPRHFVICMQFALHFACIFPRHLLFPCNSPHDFNKCRGKIVDFNKCRSEMGAILTELFQNWAHFTSTFVEIVSILRRHFLKSGAFHLDGWMIQMQWPQFS